MYPRYALSKSSIPSDPVLRIIALLAALLPLIHAMPLCRYVDPMIGTDGMGHTFPGACVPFGGVQLSPDTDTVPHNVRGVYQPEVYRYCAGYRYSDPTIVGFSHTHFSGTGHSDLGDILVMPTTGLCGSIPALPQTRIQATALVSATTQNMPNPDSTKSPSPTMAYAPALPPHSVQAYTPTPSRATRYSA